jgi:hypothetical protein
MNLGPLRLKLFAGAGSATVVGASALLVAAQPHPPGAPLRPPVTQPSPSAAGTAQPALVIPPSCGQVRLGGRNPSTGAVGGGHSVALSAAAQQALAALSQATSKAQQRRILRGLSASDRQAVTAYLHTQAEATASCAALPVQGASSGGDITPSVGSGGAVTPTIITYVS